jgi:hypothetical protein
MAEPIMTIAGVAVYVISGGKFTTPDGSIIEATLHDMELAILRREILEKLKRLA